MNKKKEEIEIFKFSALCCDWLLPGALVTMTTGSSIKSSKMKQVTPAASTAFLNWN